MFTPPRELNIADYFLDARVRDGLGARTAIVTGEGRLTYREVQALANRFGNVLRALGVCQEERVIVALPDAPEYVGALFGILKIGAVVVMCNRELKPEEISYFYDYTRARAAIVAAENLGTYSEARRGARHLRHILVVGGGSEGNPSFDELGRSASHELATAATHRDDAAIWLFSGGTTGRPKAVVQTHRSFANTTECYGKHVIQYGENDVTLSVPKLYFGYATGSNLFFPFAGGGATALFPERCTADVLFEKIRRFRPTILINVPTMINQMVNHPAAKDQDLSCLRLATSAGEALPPELYRRWKETFQVELLDGLGTAEMWHIFMSNRIGEVRPGTLGKVVPGFEAKLCDADGREVGDGDVGALWVKGDSRAIGYWQQMERTMAAFQGEWYVSGDLLSRDADGYYTYHGRSDDMLKVSGKWVSPQEVENCLLKHALVKECAVVGVKDDTGLTKPHAFVVAREETPGLADELKAFVKERLDPYKYPREVFFMASLPRTHLGKVDRGKLRDHRAATD
ncbi:MAG: benzoate-CoA ligase family protein [Acidobacteriota bacterium]